MKVTSNPPSSASFTPHPAELRMVRHSARHTVLAYHELSDAFTDYSYALSCRQLEEHLQLWDEFRLGNKDKEPPLVLSFDDGHISNYTRALPLLEKYRCKAIFFVIAGRIGEHKDFMAWSHLKELVSLGHRVESHSWSHKFLTDCNDRDLKDELVRSRVTLEDRLGASVRALSAPHGRWNRRVLAACSNAGYSRLYSSDPWPSSFTMNAMEILGRLVMVQSMNADYLVHWLTMGRAEEGIGRTRHAVKQSVRRLLGNKLYYWLWARFSGWDGPQDTLS